MQINQSVVCYEIILFFLPFIFIVDTIWQQFDIWPSSWFTSFILLLFFFEYIEKVQYLDCMIHPIAYFWLLFQQKLMEKSFVYNRKFYIEIIMQAAASSIDYLIVYSIQLSICIYPFVWKKEIFFWISIKKSIILWIIIF